MSTYRHRPGRNAGMPAPRELPLAPHELRYPGAPYTPIRPGRPAPEEPWFDTRYQTPNEVPDDGVGAAYRGGPDPDYIWDDYTQMPLPPGPKPSMLDGRAPGLPRPNHPPPFRPPTYRDTVRAGELTGPLWARENPPLDVDLDADAGTDPTDAPADQPDLRADAGWQALMEQTFPQPVDPAPVDSFPTSPPEDLESLVNQHFPRAAPEPDPWASAEQAFDEQMRQAFAPPPEPAPWPDPSAGYGELEQQLLEPPWMMPDLPPYPDLPMLM